MTEKDFITGEIYTYCHVDYCYLGYKQNHGDLVFCLEQNPKYHVVLGEETFNRIYPANRKYLTISKLKNNKIYTTAKGIDIIGKDKAELDFYGYVMGIEWKENKPFVFETADGHTINLNHKDIRQLKLKQ